MTSPLIAVAKKGVAILKRVRVLESDRRPAPEALRADAIRVAGEDESEVERARKIVAKGQGVDDVQTTLRRYSKVIGEGRFLRAYPDPSKICRVYGTETLGGQLGQHRITAGVLQVLAVEMAIERYPDVWGTVTDFDAHDAEIAGARADLENIQNEMRGAYSEADLIYVDADPFVTPSERARGLRRVVFDAFPHISPADGDWTSRFLESMITPPPPVESLEHVPSDELSDEERDIKRRQLALRRARDGKAEHAAARQQRKGKPSRGRSPTRRRAA